MGVSDIVCRREAGLVRVEGATQTWVRHSPAGFEWGSGGSGAAELALNILLEATGERDFAAEHHQAFQWAFGARMPFAVGKIEAARISEWIAERRPDRETIQCIEDRPRSGPRIGGRDSA